MCRKMRATFILLPWLIFVTSGRRCGRPGAQGNCKIIPDKEGPYDEGEEVTYRCNDGYYTEENDKFYKEAKRTCMCDGRWAGTVPYCNYKDIFDRKHFTTDNGFENTSNIFDGRNDTCVNTTVSSTARSSEFTVYFRLANATGNFSLAILVKNKDKQEEVSMLVRRDKSPLPNCRSTINPLKSTTYTFPCEVNFNTAAVTAYIAFTVSNNGESRKIDLCFLNVLIRLKEPNYPPLDRPLNGNYTLDATGDIATYSCDKGYKLPTEKQSLQRTIMCNSQKIPICVSVKEKECARLPNITNGHLALVSQNCQNETNMNDIAKLECDAGYIPRVPSQVVFCNESTGWTWKVSPTDRHALPQGNECLLPNNPTTLKLTHYHSASNASLSAISTELVVFIVIGTLIVICLLLFFLCRRIRRKWYLSNATEDTTTTANLLNNLPNNTRVEPLVESASRSHSSDGLQNMIQHTQSDEVIYAQVEILSPPSSSTSSRYQQESTIYAEVKFPQPSMNTPIVKFHRSCNDTFGKVKTSALNAGG